MNLVLTQLLAGGHHPAADEQHHGPDHPHQVRSHRHQNNHHRPHWLGSFPSFSQDFTTSDFQRRSPGRLCGFELTAGAAQE